MGALPPMSYMIPLFLGMTFDARNSRPGIDLYDKDFVDNPQEESFQRQESHYAVLSTRKEVEKSLGISGELALKIKTGMVDVKGKGSYLKAEKDYSNSVLVLTVLKHTSVTKFLSSKAKPREGWAKKYSAAALGTHYVSSITYGAELIASAKFIVHDTSDVSTIKAEIEGSIGTGGKGTELVASGKLDMLQKNLTGRANLEISYYGTVPLKAIPNTVAGLTKLITTFPEQIKEAGLENGIPMTVQLSPLYDIADPADREKFDYEVSEEMEDDFSQFSENMNELLQAREDLTNYARGLPYSTNKEAETEIGGLIQDMEKVLQVYYEVLWRLDMSKGSDQLQRALKAYDEDTLTSGKYARLVRQMKRKTEKSIKRGSNVATATFIHWGRNTCGGGKDTELLYEGFTFSSAEEGMGGASQYGCAPKTITVGYDLGQNSNIESHLAGIRYAEFDHDSNPFKGEFAKDVSRQGVTCAKCYSPITTTTAMFPASEKCPLSWEFLYGGYLMSSREKRGMTTEYICVDETPSMPYKMDNLESDKNILALTTIHRNGSLPQNSYIEGALVKCVVCAMTDSQIPF